MWGRLSSYGTVPERADWTTELSGRHTGNVMGWGSFRNSERRPETRLSDPKSNQHKQAAWKENALGKAGQDFTAFREFLQGFVCKFVDHYSFKKISKRGALGGTGKSYPFA